MHGHEARFESEDIGAGEEMEMRGESQKDERVLEFGVLGMSFFFLCLSLSRLFSSPQWLFISLPF